VYLGTESLATRTCKSNLNDHVMVRAAGPAIIVLYKINV
jgi:hypothetical protein